MDAMRGGRTTGRSRRFPEEIRLIAASEPSLMSYVFVDVK
jgi:hypothetical protein